jgi:hypothetical protein
LYLYHEREPINNRPKLCSWTTKQRLTIEHIAAGTNAVIFSTNTGQVYTASLDKLSNVNKKVEHGNCLYLPFIRAWTRSSVLLKKNYLSY